MKNRQPTVGIVLFIWTLAFIPQCARTPDADLVKYKIITEISDNRASPFYINFAQYPEKRTPLPIGIFDSGTGGLTVLDSIIKMDRYNNKTMAPGADGIPDLQQESFIYLGDRANMPYGRYQSEGKTDFLRELVVKDVQFLLSKRYFPNPDATVPCKDKEQVKAIVVACNTATAFGFDLIGKAMARWKLDLPVLGIIDAGVKSAVETLPAKAGQFTVAIMATEGTCATGGYPRAFKKYRQPKFTEGDIAIIQQPGFGLAAAIDGDLMYIDPGAREVRGRVQYQGPSLSHPWHSIDQRLWPQYNFSSPGLLVRKDEAGNLVEVELNSVSNYIRYHVTHMVEKAAVQFPGRQLKAVILGCTHYPFYTGEIREHLHYLRKRGGKYPQLIAKDILIIDPANALAAELYSRLAKQQLIQGKRSSSSQFFISVPDRQLTENKINDRGEFTFAHKYGRDINRHVEFVKRVPFSTQSLSPEIFQRIKEKMPFIYDMILRLQ
jgi:glutamate racemase